MERTMRIALALVTVAATVAAQTPAPASTIAVIPLPTAVVTRRGDFVLTASSTIVTDPALKTQGRQLADLLNRPTGFDLAVHSGGTPAQGFIALRIDQRLATALGEEGYRLDATIKGVTIRAATPHGVFHGMQTLLQLLPVHVYRQAAVTGLIWRVPAVAVEDTPRFSWRGAHLDVSRHFMPKEFVKKYIDLLAIHKMNRFHWHLTDDQGWRLEIKKYPKLTAVGAWRTETLVGHDVRDSSPDAARRKFDGVRHGGFSARGRITFAM